MAEEYTPTTEEVRHDYVSLDYPEGGYDYDTEAEEKVRAVDFDRWLAAHDAQMRADAWDEGHERGWMDGVENAEPASPNPYRKENYLYKSNGLQCEEEK